MIKVLIDTNIVLDLILDREPFVEDAIALFELIEASQVQGFIAATTITNIFYIIRKAQGKEEAFKAIYRIESGLGICAVDRDTINQALVSNIGDFEDAIQFSCAVLNQLDVIVTRDRSDFVGLDFPVLSIVEFTEQVFKGSLGELAEQ